MGDLHDAEHLIEEMLANKAKPRLGLPRLHLKLALTAIDQHESAEAVHHVGHFVQTATGPEREKGEAILAHLREADLTAPSTASPTCSGWSASRELGRHGERKRLALARASCGTFAARPGPGRNARGSVGVS